MNYELILYKNKGGLVKRSFTLIEVLIAVMIVTISSLGLYSAVLSAKRVMYAGRIRLEAQRFSYDLAYKMLHMPAADQADFLTKLSTYNGTIDADYQWYDAPSGSKTADEQMDLSVDLRNRVGKVNVSNAIFLDGRGVKVGVMVSWTNAGGDILSYTTTIYRHIGN